LIHIHTVPIMTPTVTPTTIITIARIIIKHFPLFF
jgi:hypothetical protein